MSWLNSAHPDGRLEAMPAPHIPLRIFAALLAALSIAGCATNASSDAAAERFLVAPGKYVLFNCTQIGQEAGENMQRQRELEALMMRAGPSSAGQLVSAVAYRPEYLQLRGQMTNLQRTAVDKKCKFVPGEGTAARATSGGAIR